MSGARVAWIVAIAAMALGLSASAGAAGTSAKASTTGCLAHIAAGGVRRGLV